MAVPPKTLEKPSWFLSGELDERGGTHAIAIVSTPFEVGRSPELALSLPCLSVSKLHAVLTCERESLWVRDCDSMNGTYVNGVRVTEDALVQVGDLLQFGNVVFQVCRDDEIMAESSTVESDSGERAMRLVQFDRLMSERAVFACFQPIVRLADGDRLGHEVLGRSPLFGLHTPDDMFEVAARLRLEAELSRILRSDGVQTATALEDIGLLFLNSHPVELVQPGLRESFEEARHFAPTLAMTLELHEGAVVRPSKIRELRAWLADLDIGLAYDDFGAGQHRLVELADAPPDYLKFDMTLVQGLSTAPASRQQMVAQLVRLAREAGIDCIAEGVETADDAEACRQVGFAYGQGFYFGRPTPADMLVAARTAS